MRLDLDGLAAASREALMAEWHSQGWASYITDPITDHFTPYCGELQVSAINDIRVLDEC